MYTGRVTAALSLLIPVALAAQVPPEHFERVRYMGGLSTKKDALTGFLMLADSGLEFHLCWSVGCDRKKDGSFTMPMAAIRIPYAKITDVAGSNSRVGANLTSSGTGAEFVTVSYDAEDTAEAPVFRTRQAESAQLVAKIKFHLRKLGLIPRSPPGARDSVWR